MEAPSQTVQSTPAGGSTLTSKSVSKNVLAPELGLQERTEKDNLEATRNFYGFVPSSSSSTLHPHRAPSRSGLTPSRSTLAKSPFSSASHPTSPPISPDAKSPPRTAVPLPTPRGFLTPQKPKAVQDEERARAEGQYRQVEVPANGFMPMPLNPLEVDSKQGTVTEMSQVRGSASATSLLASTYENRYPPEPPPRESVEFPSIRDRPDMASSDNLVRPSATSTSVSTTIHARQMQRMNGENERADGHGHGHDHGHGHGQLPLHTQSQSRSSKEAKRRRYKSFENPLTTFFCGGHLMTGGDDYYSVALAAFMLLAQSGIWVGTTGVWMWEHGSEYGLASGGGIGVVVVFVYLFGITISSFLVSALRDPGILPRKLDLDPPLARFEEDSYELPLDRSFAIGTGKVTVRWCETCKTYRPPRASHCRMCGNCVEGIDHHCAYIHNCVGRRNYLSFLVLLISAMIADIYIVIFSAIHFLLICRHEGVSFGQALQDSPGAAVSFLLGLMLLPAMLFLLGYHIRLMLYNITTVEQIRENASKNLLHSSKRPVNNPFSAGSKWRNVLLSTLGRPQFPSYLNASGYEDVDRRRVNPGIMARLKA